jgi:flagellar biosynthetic protein FliR
MPLITPEGAEVFGLLLVRCLGFFIAGPLFAQRNLPAQVKILLGAATALVLFPMAPPLANPPFTHLPAFLFAVAGEAFLGLILGFAATLPFVGIRMAGELIGVQMGFGIVSVMDPRQEQQLSVIAQLYDLLAVLLFLLLDGHHLLLRALATSVHTLPLGQAAVGGSVAGQLLALGGTVFVTALAVGGPLIAVLFLTDAAMGFVARTVPQMNVFIVGFPVKIGLGLMGLALTLPFFTRSMDRLLMGMERDLLALLAGM